MSSDPQDLRLRAYPDPVLRRRAVPVPEVTDHVRRVVDAMFGIMRAHEGIGLAAPQVGLSWRLFVLDVPPNDQRSPDATPPTASRGRMVFINPVLSDPAGMVEKQEEGCLSLPDIRGEVMRPPIITARALDLAGRDFTITAGGLLARCIQHEFDHLEGVLILDRMSQLSRLRNRLAIRDLEASG